MFSRPHETPNLFLSIDLVMFASSRLSQISTDEEEHLLFPLPILCHVFAPAPDAHLSSSSRVRTPADSIYPTFSRRRQAQLFQNASKMSCHLAAAIFLLLFNVFLVYVPTYFCRWIFSFFNRCVDVNSMFLANVQFYIFFKKVPGSSQIWHALCDLFE